MSVSYDELKIAKLKSSFQIHYSRTFAECAIIGLSGGIDSALSAAIVANVIGAENVFAYYLPYKTSSANSFSDAKAFADKFKINFEIIDITESCDAFFKQNNCRDDLRKGNAMARLRMATLFDIAQSKRGIVIGTSNYTELLLGYGTLFGDSASSINPIGKLYKADVVNLSKCLSVPHSIIVKAPTADLWIGQTDEQELGFSYDMADKFLFSAIELGFKYKELESLFGKELTEKIVKRVIKNRFKSKVPIICEYESKENDIDNIFNNLGVVQ